MAQKVLRISCMFLRNSDDILLLFALVYGGRMCAVILGAMYSVGFVVTSP